MSWAQVAGWIGDRWEWINDYGTAVGAVAGVVAAIVAMLALASAASDSKARSQPRVTAGYVNLGRTHQGNLSGTQGAV